MTRLTCPVCAVPAEGTFFALPQVPVFCNVLHDDRAAARAAATGDLELAACRSCGMVWNAAFDPELVSYAPSYDSSLHFSKLFRDYAAALAERLVERFALRGKDIVEIGCGKGEFLALLCRAGGNRAVGFDKSYSARADADDSLDIRIVQDDYSVTYADYPADLICCRHVLEHIAEPREFLAWVRRAAERTGAGVFFEVPNGLFTFRDLGIWDLIYEHCSYFTPPALQRAFEAAGLPPRAVETAYGDQFLCVEVDAAAGTAGLPAVEPAALEAIAGLVDRFAAHFEAKRAQWTERLRTCAVAGRRVALWGIGSKGVTFLNTVARGDEVCTAVDLNPNKYGKHVPGTGHRVEAPDSLVGQRIDVVLVANPIYRDEIAAHCAELGLAPEIDVL